MSKTHVIGGTIELYCYIDPKRRERVCTLARLPKATAGDWEGSCLNLLDWKIADDRQTVRITYQLRNDPWAPVLDAELAVETQTFPLQPPSRSRFWRWSEFSMVWIHQKTGQVVHA